MKIVSLEDIPMGQYETPLGDLTKLLETAKEMEILCRSEGGMGLAASQVGLPWRLFIYWSDYPSEPGVFSCLVDCKYEPAKENKFFSTEGCLSLPGRQFEVQRYDEILVSGKRLKTSSEGVVLEDFKALFSGVLSVVLQHEIDHNYGRERMIDKIGNPVR
ncbi:hypothetical protein EBT16_00250 [bacterium]|nr:hypothetical protein [bacterium]